MIDAHHFFLFLGAATLLAISPGPGMLYVLARTLAGGRREGVLSTVGTFLGGLVHVVAAATGLSLVLATSAVAFAIVKYAGAAYLIYLGLRMILTASEEADVHFAAGQLRRNPFWQGVATEVLNPKTAIFFLAFIPQFVNRAHGGVFWQFLLLGSISVHPQHLWRPGRDSSGYPDRGASSFICCVAPSPAPGDRSDPHRARRLRSGFRHQVTAVSISKSLFGGLSFVVCFALS